MAYAMIAAAAISLYQSSKQDKANRKLMIKQTYDKYSAHFTERLRNNMIIDTATKNITAIKNDTVKRNVRINANRAKAEAEAQVSAAASGTEGGSIKDMSYSIDANAAFAIQDRGLVEDQEINQQKASIFGANFNLQRKVHKTQMEDNTAINILNAINAGMSANQQAKSSSISI